MKLVFSVLIILISIQIHSQSCDIDNNITSQQELIDEMAQYPNCTRIEGNLRLSGSVSDLSPLNNIEVIEGDLRIGSSVIDLAGLESLDTIYGSLDIDENAELADISGIENLQHIGGDFILSNNPILAQVVEFSQLNSILGDEIDIDNNPLLESIPVFSNISEFNGTFILSNMNLTNLTGMENWRTLSRLLLTDNDLLSSLVGIQNLEVLEEGLFIDRCPLLQTIDLPSLLHTGHITLSDELTCLQANVLEFYGSDISLNQDSQLKSIDLPKLRSIEGDLTFLRTSSIIEINLPDLQNIGGDLSLTEVENLDILNLPNLVSVQENITFENNNIKELSLPSLEQTESLNLLGNNCPIEIFNFSKIKTIQTDFIIAAVSTPDDKIELFDLDTIGGDFNLAVTEDLLSLNISSKYIGGEIQVYGNFALEDISFPELTEVADGINIADCDATLKNVLFPNLISAEYFFLVDALILETLNLDKLKHVRQEFHLSFIDDLASLILNNLEDVNSFLLEFIPSLQNLSVPKLDSIHGTLTILSTSIENLQMPALEFVGSTLEIDGNVSMTSINLPNLNTVRSDLLIENETNLITLELPKLRQVFSSTELSNLDLIQEINIPNLSLNGRNFSLINNDNLKTIRMPLLTEIGNRLTISENNNLDRLDLYQLTELNGTLQISNNDVLPTLEGIQNINPDGVSFLVIQDNPLLTFCRVPSICGLILDPEKEKTIEDNAEGCQNEMQIDCEGITFGGQIFYDVNQNGTKDIGEIGLPNIPINIPELNLSINTRNGGFYTWIAEDNVNYTIMPDIDNILDITTGQDFYNFTFEQDTPGFRSFDFGVIHNEPTIDGEIILTSEFTRCNTQVDFNINYSSQIAQHDDIDEVYIRFDLDPNTAFVSSAITPENIDQNFVVFKLSNLETFEQRSIDMIIEMPNEMLTGELMSFDVEAYVIDPSNPSQNIVIDSYTYESIVRCSFDPNDKQVSPVGRYQENYTLFEDILTYTVRFQNTGNAEAINVEILDTLDAALDLNTFRVLSNSHPVVTTLRDRSISFLFENIFLPDSTSNEPESHGFITYEIMTSEGIPDPTIVSNTAHIIFDANPAIITNTTMNTMVETFPTVSVSDPIADVLKVYPNPSSSNVMIEVDDFIHAELFDFNGQKVLESNSQNLDVRNLPSKIYLLKIRTDGQIFHTKLSIHNTE